MAQLLDSISSVKDLRSLSEDQLPKLAQELREFIIDVVATKAGHLGASLGVIELTIALHYLFDTPEDLLIWDVGHQAYGHKILTGRKNQFETNRQLHGIAGFPSRAESEFDAFGVGHSSTSISAALGMAIASGLKGDHEKQHIAVIGDASIASGMAFEGLNHAGVTKANLLIVLNDNAIGIDPSVGALKEYLTKVKSDKSLARNNIIRALNFDYSGPIDGHDFEALLKELKRLKKKKGPKFLHIITTKGKGLQQAEKDQVTYHAPGKFDAKTGNIPLTENKNLPPKYQDVFGETLVELAQKNERIVGITPAMLTGSSMKKMMARFPDRTFDVGIAEQHAVTLAAGLAAEGMIPYCNIYSTFLQRAYDQIIHDVALQKLPVIFCLDRAGLVGEDGATHHGVFDIAFLRAIPNMVIAAPRNERELRSLLYTAQESLSGPMAIRYPRGRGSDLDWKQPFASIPIGTGVCLRKGTKVAVLSYGTVAENVTSAISNLPEVGHYDLRFVKPLDTRLLDEIFSNYQTIVTVEDGVVAGGFGSAILAFAAEKNYKQPIEILGVPDNFIEHGSIAQLQAICGLDPHSIRKSVQQFL